MQKFQFSKVENEETQDLKMLMINSTRPAYLQGVLVGKGGGGKGYASASLEIWETGFERPGIQRKQSYELYVALVMPMSSLIARDNSLTFTNQSKYIITSSILSPIHPTLPNHHTHLLHPLPSPFLSHQPSISPPPPSLPPSPSSSLLHT